MRLERANYLASFPAAVLNHWNAADWDLGFVSVDFLQSKRFAVRGRENLSHRRRHVAVENALDYSDPCNLHPVKKKYLNKSRFSLAWCDSFCGVPYVPATSAYVQ